MSSNDQPSAASELEALSASYGAALPRRLDDLEAAARPIAQGGARDQIRQSLDDTRELAHKLAGTAATFGYQAITESARALENLSEILIGARRQPKAEETARLQDLLQELREAASMGPGSTTGKDHSAGSRPSSAPADGAIFLIHRHPDVAGLLARRIESTGHSVRLFSRAQEMVDAVKRSPPRAILVPTAFPGWLMICRDIAEWSRGEPQTHVPIICLSDGDDFDSRLAAIRAGASGYMLEPWETAELTRNLEELSAATAFVPYRVLIVEDDELLAAHYAAAFEGPTYKARIVGDPRTVLDDLETLDAELIVMNMSLADCSGLELAKIVWQHESYRDVGILFISRGPAFNRDLLKIGLTDEHFLPRPVDTDELCTLASRQMFNMRAGRAFPERLYLASQLDRIAALEVPDRGSGGHRKIEAVMAPQPQAASHVAPKVLVVDDDRDLVKAIGIKLAACGVEVLKAFNGEQGFEKAWRGHPDVIISDYEMPNGSGDYLLRRLSGSAETKGMPVIILTGRKFDGRKDFALERELIGRLGAVSYLTKPISLDALVEELGRHIRLPREVPAQQTASASRLRDAR